MRVDLDPWVGQLRLVVRLPSVREPRWVEDDEVGLVRTRHLQAALGAQDGDCDFTTGPIAAQ